MPLFTRHSTLLQTAYSELKRRALEQATVLAGTPGSVGVRTVSGRSFYYRQFYDALGNALPRSARSATRAGAARVVSQLEKGATRGVPRPSGKSSEPKDVRIQV